MRTTLDLPDELARTLKLRAAARGKTLKQVVAAVIEAGLRSDGAAAPVRRPPPPVMIPDIGRPLPVWTAEQLRQLEEQEDVERYARYFGHQRVAGAEQPQPRPSQVRPRVLVGPRRRSGK